MPFARAIKNVKITLPECENHPQGLSLDSWTMCALLNTARGGLDSATGNECKLSQLHGDIRIAVDVENILKVRVRCMRGGGLNCATRRRLGRAAHAAVPPAGPDASAMSPRACRILFMVSYIRISLFSPVAGGS